MRTRCAQCSAYSQRSYANVTHGVAVQIYDLPCDHTRRLHVDHNVGRNLVGLQHQKRPLATARLNKPRAIYRDNVSPRLDILYLESALRVSCPGVLVCLVITGAKLHIRFSYRLSYAIFQDLSFYAYTSCCLGSSLNCEGGHEKERKNQKKIFHRRPPHRYCPFVD